MLRGNVTRRNTVVIALVILLTGLAPAQQPTFRDPLADKLTGDWVLSGTIAGKQTTHDIHAAWVLNHQFVLIHEVSREKNEKGEPQYEAMVYVGFDEKSKQYAIFWIDIWGGASPQSIGYAKPEPNRMPFLFKGADDTFHTTFIYDDKSDTWEWQMDSEKDGKFTPFARVKLKRKG